MPAAIELEAICPVSAFTYSVVYEAVTSVISYFTNVSAPSRDRRKVVGEDSSTSLKFIELVMEVGITNHLLFSNIVYIFYIPNRPRVALKFCTTSLEVKYLLYIFAIAILPNKL